MCDVRRLVRDKIRDFIAVNRHRFIAFLVAILLLIFHAPMVYAKNGAPSVTVCDLLGSPIRYDGKIVEVHAELILGMHGGVLIDDRCNSDLGAIRLIIAKELYKNKKVAAMIRMVMSRHARAQVVLTGSFDKTPTDTADGSFTLRTVP